MSQIRCVYETGVIDYIRDYYEAMHATGRQYIVDDISMYIEVRQPFMA